MKVIPANPTRKDLKRAKLQVGLNIFATIALFVLYFIGRQHNFENAHEGDTSTYYEKMKYCILLGCANAVYTIYLLYWYNKLRQRVKK
jgi:hypothetical protein